MSASQTSLHSGFQLPENSTLARIGLAFLATAGLFYVNIMPALVDGLIKGLGFTKAEAGMVGSANVYGAAVGALIAVFLIKHVRWKMAMVGLLSLLIALDFVSMWMTTPDLLIATRFIHGFVGGLSVGIGFGIIARTIQPDKTFGYLLVIQFGFGGLGVMFLPPLVPEFGTNALFWSLIIFTVVSMLFIPFMGRYHVTDTTEVKTEKSKIEIKPLALTLLALFLFQAANMGPFAYIVPLGESAGLSLDFITTSLGLAGWIGIAGSMLVVIISTKYGRLVPLMLGIALTLIGTAFLVQSETAIIYLVANCAVGVTWALVIPYLLGMAAEFDKAGQMAALGGFASKMGLASGPLLSAWALGESNYTALILLSVVLLFICMIVLIQPTRLLDSRQHASKAERSEQAQTA